MSLIFPSDPTLAAIVAVLLPTSGSDTVKALVFPSTAFSDAYLPVSPPYSECNKLEPELIIRIFEFFIPALLTSFSIEIIPALV